MSGRYHGGGAGLEKNTAPNVGDCRGRTDGLQLYVFGGCAGACPIVPIHKYFSEPTTVANVIYAKWKKKRRQLDKNLVETKILKFLL